MFYAMWLVCIVGMEPECKEIQRTQRVWHKTEEACLADALEQTNKIIAYLIANGLVGQAGYKCVLDKDHI